MAGIGKIVIGAILASVLIVFLSRLAALFPFYMTIVVETFNLANIAAADNYIKEPYLEAAEQGLQERPLFNQNPDEVRVEIWQIDDNGGRIREAVGSANEFDYEFDPSYAKPYRQRGAPLQITITAVYPMQFTLWGQEVGFDVPITFSLNTIGLKYYKDLPLDNPYEDDDFDDIDYFDYLYDETGW